MTDTELAAEMAAETDAILAKLGPITRQIITDGAQLIIEREYGADTLAMIGGNNMLAQAGIGFDLGTTDKQMIATVLRIAFKRALAARRCQCTAILTEGHGHYSNDCAGHYEQDVPAVDGLYVCGGCYARTI